MKNIIYSIAILLTTLGYGCRNSGGHLSLSTKVKKLTEGIKQQLTE